MQTTDRHSLEDKKRLARKAHKARLKVDKNTPGCVPVYHDGLFSYLRWALGELPPCRAEDTPIGRAEGINYWQYETNYGRYRPLSEVDDFLQELLGKMFIEAFKFEASIVDYQYLADKIEEVVAELLKRGRPTPSSMARASKWLNEQLMQLKESRPTIVADTATPPSMAALNGSPSPIDSAPTSYLEIIHSVADSSDTLVEDAVLIEESVILEQSSTLNSAERIPGSDFASPCYWGRVSRSLYTIYDSRQGKRWQAMETPNEKNAKYRALAEYDTIVQPVVIALDEIDWPHFIDAYAKLIADWQPQMGGVTLVKQKIEESCQIAFDIWNATYQRHKSLAANLRYFLAREVKVTAMNVGSKEGPLHFITTFPFSTNELVAPVYIGEYMGRMQHFLQCLKEFHEEETSAADVRHCFPEVTTIHSSTTSDTLLNAQGFLDATSITAKRTRPNNQASTISEWVVLLNNLEEDLLREVAIEMGLFDTAIKPPARAWSGLVLELKVRRYLPEDANAEALVRAFRVWGVVVNPGSIRTPAKGAELWRCKASRAFKTVLSRQIL